MCAISNLFFFNNPCIFFNSLSKISDCLLTRYELQLLKNFFYFFCMFTIHWKKTEYLKIKRLEWCNGIYMALLPISKISLLVKCFRNFGSCITSFFFNVSRLKHNRVVYCPLLLSKVLDHAIKICKKKCKRLTVGNWQMINLKLLFADDMVLVAKTD